MKVIFTEEAVRDLDGILEYIAANYPTISTSFEKRLRAVLRASGHGRRVRKRSQSGRTCAWCRSSDTLTKSSTASAMK
jgi:plasmid stabilization system protein ParE